MTKLNYLNGLGNHFSSEAVEGSLPQGQNSPQRCAYGLYAEQFSGSAFTQPRSHNLRSWLYRIQPSVSQGEWTPFDGGAWTGETHPTPNALRWNPLPIPKKPTDFIDGTSLLLTAGEFDMRRGCSIYLYAISAPMKERFFSNADGEFLIVPQEGELLIETELGKIELLPHEIAVLPRGIRFQVNPVAKQARGYLCENFGAPFRLPDLGPIGANGLANPRDFEVPVAAFYESTGQYTLVHKFSNCLWTAPLKHHALNVVAWHGNHVPYKYDLRKFNTINTVSYDHPDPSIFTVLTSPTDTAGLANIDFVIFPPRWMVAEHTFRPPYYHRNIMNEYMGLIHGVYDAKTGGGFVPGGGSLHNCMTPHGPDGDAFEKASKAPLKPHYIAKTMAFMFETSLPFQVSKWGMAGGLLQKNYQKVWQNLKTHWKQGKQPWRQSKEN